MPTTSNNIDSERQWQRQNDKHKHNLSYKIMIMAMSHRISSQLTVIVLICSSTRAPTPCSLATQQLRLLRWQSSWAMVRVSLSCSPAVCSVLLGFDPVFRSPMVHVWHISQRIGIGDWSMWYWQYWYCPCKTIYINLYTSLGSPTLCWWYPPDMPQLHMRSMLIRFSSHFFSKGNSNMHKLRIEGCRNPQWRHAQQLIICGVIIFSTI